MPYYISINSFGDHEGTQSRLLFFTWTLWGTRALVSAEASLICPNSHCIIEKYSQTGICKIKWVPYEVSTEKNASPYTSIPTCTHSLSIVSLVEDLFTVFILCYPEECSAVVDVFLLSGGRVIWNQSLEFPLADASKLLLCVYTAGAGLWHSRTLTASIPLNHSLSYSYSNSSQHFWHQELVLWKTVFPWMGGGDDFGDDSSTLHLLCTLFLLLLP